MEDEEPDDDEYDASNEEATFAWDSLRIFVLKKNNRKEKLCGIVVFHSAYMSSYPGPDESHHMVEPELMAEGKNISTEIGYTGESDWVDIPILCGSG